MREKIFAVFFFVSLCCSSSSECTEFGYISYSSNNVGDDIQSIAAKRFLPENSIPIDREFIGEFHHDGKVKTIVNGWFMQTKTYGWYRADVAAPEKSWPPSPSIDPLFISIHLARDFIPTAFSDEAIEYLRRHGPVGARDYPTLRELRKRGIPSYFSGCLTLTLENTCKGRDDIIYVVDIDDECVDYIKSKTKSRVKIVRHVLSFLPLLTNKQRLDYAEKLLQKYGRAKCVITSRLHATMPCLALKTPVLLIRNDRDPRFEGLKELVRWGTKEDLLQGNIDFNFDEPTANPSTYIPLREKLIKRVRNWVARNNHG